MLTLPDSTKSRTKVEYERAQQFCAHKMNGGCKSEQFNWEFQVLLDSYKLLLKGEPDFQEVHSYLQTYQKLSL